MLNSSKKVSCVNWKFLEELIKTQYYTIQTWTFIGIIDKGVYNKIKIKIKSGKEMSYMVEQG